MVDRLVPFLRGGKTRDDLTGLRGVFAESLANLIENAPRHTPAGSDVTLTVDGPRLILADTGPGIPAEERDKVLRRLYRLDRSRSTPGNGLGLSLVDAIVKLHGGSLELLDNAPGLRVVASFPVA